MTAPLKIAILGTRGIPNNYGGFERLAEKLATGLAERGMEVSVYSVHNHPYQEKDWNGVKIIHIYNPESILGSAGQFIYDATCILDSRKHTYDLILQLGYTTSAPWYFLHPADAKVITNIDGLEWTRSKYKGLLSSFLRRAEKRAVNGSDAVVSDSKVIQEYVREKYNRESPYIAYGAEIKPALEKNNGLEEMGLSGRAYNLVIARFQTDNNIETIIRGHKRCKNPPLLLIVGNWQNRYGKKLRSTYADDNIRFSGAIFDPEKLHSLRSGARLYFHGHSGGGTNPSLLEAMADRALICAHNNPFNREVLEENALYFENEEQIRHHIENIDRNENTLLWINANLEKIRRAYDWEDINDRYAALIRELTQRTLTKS